MENRTPVTVLLVCHGETQVDVWKRNRTGTKPCKFTKVDPALSAAGLVQAQSMLRTLCEAGGFSDSKRTMAVFSAPTKACACTAAMLASAGLAKSEAVQFNLTAAGNGASILPIVVMNGLCHGMPEIDMNGDSFACIQKGYLPCAAADYNACDAKDPIMGVVDDMKRKIKPEAADATQYLRFTTDNFPDPTLPDQKDLVPMTPSIDLTVSPTAQASGDVYKAVPKAKKDKNGKQPVFSDSMWKAGAKPTLHMASSVARRVGCDTVIAFCGGDALQRMVEVAGCDDYMEPPPLSVASFTADLHDDDESGRLITWKLHGIFTKEQIAVNPRAVWPPFAGPVTPYGQSKSAASLPDDAKRRALEEYRRKAKAEYNKSNGIIEDGTQQAAEPAVPPPAPISSPDSSESAKKKPAKRGILRSKSSELADPPKRSLPARSTSFASSDSGNKKLNSSKSSIASNDSSSGGVKKTKLFRRSSSHSAESTDSSGGVKKNKLFRRSSSHSADSTDPGNVVKRKSKKTPLERSKSADQVVPLPEAPPPSTKNKTLSNSDHQSYSLEQPPSNSKKPVSVDNDNSTKKKSSSSKTKDDGLTNSNHSLHEIDLLLRDDEEEEESPIRNKKSDRKKSKEKMKRRSDKNDSTHSMSSISLDEDVREKAPRRKKKPERSISEESLGSILEAGKKLNERNNASSSSNLNDKPKEKRGIVGNKTDRKKEDSGKATSKELPERPPPKKRETSSQVISEESMKWLEQDLYSDFSRSSSSSSADSDSFWSSVASSIAGNSVYGYDDDSSVTHSVTASVNSGDSDSGTEKKRTRRPMNFLKDLARKPSFEM